MSSKELYEWYKAHGICVTCKREPARKGRVQCTACAGLRAVTQKSYNECNKERIKERNKRVTEKRKAEHRCVDCGRPLPDGQTTFICRECTTKRATRKRLRKARELYG